MLLHARILEIGQTRARAVFLRFKNFLYRPNESHDFVSLCFVIQWVVSCSIDVLFQISSKVVSLGSQSLICCRVLMITKVDYKKYKNASVTRK